MEPPYLVDADNADYVSGKTTEPPGTARWIILVLSGFPTFIAAVGLIFGVLAFDAGKQWQALEEDGLVAAGHYTELPRSEFGATGRVSGAEYQFTVDGRSYSGSHAIAYAVLPGTHVGDPVRIRYLADDPQVSAPVDEPFPTGFLGTSAILLCVAAIFGVAAGKLLWGSVQDGKRWRAARIVRGEVISVAPTPPVNAAENKGAAPAAPIPLLTYSFKSPQSGKTLTRQQKISVETPDAPFPEAGRAVAVRFLNDENCRLL